MKRKGAHLPKHDFLRRVVRLCLVMMVLLTVSTIAACLRLGIAPDAASLGVLMGGWCGELLLTLLKRKFEQEDKTESKTETQESVTKEETTWNSGT